MYELRIRNRSTLGCSTISADTIQQIRDKLKKYYIDRGSKVRLYEVKEIPINTDWYDIIDRSKVKIKEDIYDKLLYETACILKSNTERR